MRGAAFRDPERLARFEQEARSASALNHPNIVTIYDGGNVEDVRYIAMELVEGRTLRQVLREGLLLTRRALQLAAQAAEGLAEANAAGIVHRDLKPENLMVAQGRVKILDFGLAKLTHPETPGSGTGVETALPTVSEAGQMLGTVGYMAPEQVEGKTVGPTADVFSLGTVLYEMLSGRRAFQGVSVVDTLHAILAPRTGRGGAGRVRTRGECQQEGRENLFEHHWGSQGEGCQR